MIGAEVLNDVQGLSAELGGAWTDGTLLRDTTMVLIGGLTGGSAEVLFWGYAAGLHRSLSSRQPRSALDLLAVMVRRAVLEIMAVVAFSASTWVVVDLLGWPQTVKTTTTALVAGLSCVRTALALERLFATVRPERLRLLAVSTERAQARATFVSSLAITAAVTATLASLLTPRAPHLASAVMDLGGIAAGGILLFALARRSGLSRRRRKRTMVDLLPLGLIVATLACGVAWLTGHRLPVLTIAAFSLVVWVDLSVEGVWERVRAEQSAATSWASVLGPVLRRALRILLAVTGLIVAAALCGVPLQILSDDASPSDRLFHRAGDIVMVVLLADLVWLAAAGTIDQHLALVAADDGPDGATRLQTLLPLLKRTVLGVLSGSVFLIVLSSLGINIAPLLAGAGVAGLAVGFGAQTLVRDIITGVFFLIEDAFRVGEYVQVGQLSGTVEAIALRSLRIRHHRGALHTLPFGEIRHLTNHSRDWVVVKLDFRVPFSTDFRTFKRLVKQVGAELSADPELGPHIIETLKSQGVNRIEEFWLVFRVKFTAKPNEAQYVIRREAYHRMLAALDAEGIRIGDRRLLVEVARPTGSESEPALSAAAVAIEQADGQAQRSERQTQTS